MNKIDKQVDKMKLSLIKELKELYDINSEEAESMISSNDIFIIFIIQTFLKNEIKSVVNDCIDETIFNLCAK